MYLLVLVYSPSISIAVLLYHSLLGKLHVLNCSFEVRQFTEGGNSLQTERPVCSVDGDDVKM